MAIITEKQYNVPRDGKTVAQYNQHVRSLGFVFANVRALKIDPVAETVIVEGTLDLVANPTVTELADVVTDTDPAVE